MELKSGAGAGVFLGEDDIMILLVLGREDHAIFDVLDVGQDIILCK